MCNKHSAGGNGDDKTNRRVSTYRPKSSDHSLEELIFQVEGGSEYQPSELCLVSWIQGLQHCGWRFEEEALPKARRNEGHCESLDLPAKKKGRQSQRCNIQT